MIRRPPRSTQSRSSAASDVYKRQGSPSASWPFDQLTQRAIPDEPSPWLHAHYRRFITTTRRSASDRGNGTQLLTVSAARSTPSRPRRIHHGDHVRARLPTFPAKAAGEGHAASVPDTAWPIDGHPPDLLPDPFE